MFSEFLLSPLITRLPSQLRVIDKPNDDNSKHLILLQAKCCSRALHAVVIDERIGEKIQSIRSDHVVSFVRVALSYCLLYNIHCRENLQIYKVCFPVIFWIFIVYQMQQRLKLSLLP